MQPVAHNSNSPNNAKKIIIIMMILGLLIASLTIFFIQQTNKSKTVPSEHVPALEYINQFNSFMVNDPDKAYEEIEGRFRPERQLFNASASFFRSDIEINKCKYKDAKDYFDQVTEVTISCPLRNNQPSVAIEYQVSKSTDNSLSILSYEFAAD